jgi:effector-binding domain-containing protein
METEENRSAPDSGLVEVVPLSRQATAVVRGIVAAADLVSFFDRAFSSLPAECQAQGVEITGPPFALYRRPPGESIDLEVGFPTDGVVEPRGEIRPSELPEGRAATATHRGAYDGLGQAWQSLFEAMQAAGLKPAFPFWEVYATKPSPDMDPTDLMTQLYCLT